MKFEPGKIYFGWTQKGDLRLLKVSERKESKAKASFNGGKEKYFEIKTTSDGNEFISPDKRFSLIVTATEYKGGER